MNIQSNDMYLDQDEDPALEPQVSVRRKMRTAFIAIGLLLLALVLSATVVQIGGAVIGSGHVAVESKIKRIAHPTGGVIAEVLVRDGTRVKQGDVLMRLDTAVSGVSATLTGETVDQLMARKARLEAESQERPSILFPAELTSRGDSPDVRAAMEAETRAFRLRRAERVGTISQLNERIRQLDQQIRSYRAQANAVTAQSRLIQPEREGVRELWQEKLVTISRLNQLERTAVDLQGSAAALEANIAQIRARISETREQMISVGAAARSEAAVQLAEVNTMLNDQRMRRASAGDTFGRAVIRAPSDGVVDKLAFATIGGVVPPAQTILEIVPVKDDLTVEAQISPADIDRVRVGQAARIRFTAFSAQTTPEIPGKVTFVSAERTTDERTGVSFYRVEIEVDRAALQREADMQLVPGMPAETYIQTGNRSLLSYVFKPLRDQLARAFRDN